MRRAFVITVAALAWPAAACQDPTVDVVVTTPDGYRPTTLAVSVLTPGDDLSCAEVALGRLSADARAVIEATGVTVRLDEGRGLAIAGVPRTEAKLWLAEGRDDAGTLIVAGCTAQGAIDDDVTVTIATEVAGQLLGDPHRAEEPLPAGVALTVDDGLAAPAPIAGRAIEAVVFGAGGAALTAAAAVTDADGRARVELATPGGFGPQMLQLRAPWLREQPVVVSGFRTSARVARDINAVCTTADDVLAVATAGWRTLQLDGARALAGLARDGARAHVYVAAWDGAGVVDGCSAELPALGFAAMRDAGGAPVDRLVVVGASTWQALAIEVDGGELTVAAGAPVSWANPTNLAPIALVTAEACAGGPAGDVVLAQLVTGAVIAFDRAGAVLADDPLATQLTAYLTGQGMPRPRLVAAVCTSVGGAAPVHAALLETPRASEDAAALRGRWLAVERSDGPPAVVPVLSFGAVGFAHPDEAALLVGGALEPSGAKVVRWELALAGGALELRETARHDALGSPASLAVGYLDGDDRLDTVWGLVDAIQGGLEDARVQIELGADADGLPLSGISPAVASGAAAVFLAEDPARRTADLMIGGARQVVFLDTDAP